MKKKILVVDDEKVNRLILKKILCATYEILEAENGRDALELLRRDDAEVALVILDLVMPVMDGYGLLENLQNDAALASIPVVVASQAEKSAAEERALQFGARDFIVKPYNPGVLLRRVANLIEMNESSKRIAVIERDYLTDVFTREAFCTRVSEVLEQNPDVPYAMAATNIEHFKVVNEIYVTEEGDRLLQYVAKELRREVREAGGICGRYSSDHFVFLVPTVDSISTLEQTVERFNQYFYEYPRKLKLTIKFGIYMVEDRSISPVMMCDRAKTAAESIKGKYNLLYAHYDDSMRRKMLMEQNIIDSMRAALEERQFQVYYQPKYDLDSECMAGAEALVRWKHPEMGFLNPGNFIPLFEKNGFITELDKYVWERTCEDLAEWLRRGGKYVPVSVNVSRNDIYNENLPDYFDELIRRHGLQPKHLHLEITETAYTTDAQQLIGVVTELKKRGFVIEMDDFGTGYSSLNMLSELPIDVLKLDMRFIQRETERNQSRSILSFIISLAKWLQLSVVAEGVESKEQIELLRSLDCELVQGYYFAKPMPREEFEEKVLSSVLVLPDKAHQPSVSLNVTENGQNSRKMLIVDDVEANRAVLKEAFRPFYTIAEAANGLDAYSYVQENFDTLDVILLDLLMPVMDGYEMLKKLRANTLYSEIPVVVTSQVNSEGEEKAFRLGASDFLKKPYDLEIALHRVENVTARAQVRVLKREKEVLSKMRRVVLATRLDPLTGIYSAAEAEERVRSYASRPDDGQAVFLLVDVDGLKEMNGAFGREIGDEVLQTVADTLLAEFDDQDTVCRLPGDEFSVFCERDISKENLQMYLKRLCTRLSLTVHGTRTTCSIGVSCAPAQGKTYEELHAAAAAALESAKKRGGRIAVFAADEE